MRPVLFAAACIVVATPVAAIAAAMWTAWWYERWLVRTCGDD